MKRKRVCEGCKRKIRTCSLTKNKINDKLLCKRCNNKLGSNKFYSPLMSRENKRINNFNITDLEKEVLIRKKSMRHINSLCVQLRKIRKASKQRKVESKIAEENKKKEQIEMQKKFLEGLIWRIKKYQ